MKIRSDFVTNSSSSSFVLARRTKLTKEQQEIILNYVEERMFGEEIASTEEELKKYYRETMGWTDEEFEDKDACEYKEYQEALKQIKKGYCIWCGYVSFESGDEHAELLNELWDLLERNTPEDFIGIDTFLSY